MCLKSTPLKGKEAQGFPHQLPSLISRGSLTGSSLPGTLGGEGQYAMNLYRNCGQVTSGMDYGDAGGTGSIWYS